jgi:hypothetical protein
VSGRVDHPIASKHQNHSLEAWVVSGCVDHPIASSELAAHGIDSTVDRVIDLTELS